jgi:hypothetical protein
LRLPIGSYKNSIKVSTFEPSFRIKEHSHNRAKRIS